MANRQVFMALFSVMLIMTSIVLYTYSYTYFVVYS